MPISLPPKTCPRILIEVALKPVAGTRIQPTGFPDLGPALYDAPISGGATVPTLLVESPQSMANRLEAVCWDDAANDIVPELTGLPYVRVKLENLGGGQDMTSSLLEFHRLNSPYIMSGTTPEGQRFAEVVTRDLGLATATERQRPGAGGSQTEDGVDVAGVVNLRRLAEVCLKYDPNSLVHGVFLEKIAGRLRHPRAVSAFIEAADVGRADSGGVKVDRVLPNPKVARVDAKGGYGNVPFHRTEFTAGSITAYFSFDLAQIRGYGLPPEAEQLLIVLALWKVRRFLDSNMRLRSACELELKDGEDSIVGKRPAGFRLPLAADLEPRLKELIGECRQNKRFAEPAVTELTWRPRT